MDLKRGQSFPCLRGYVSYEVLCSDVYTHANPPRLLRPRPRPMRGSDFKPLALVAGPLGVRNGRRGVGSGPYALLLLGDLSIHPTTLSGHITGKVPELRMSVARLPPSLPQRGRGEVSHYTHTRQSRHFGACDARRLQRPRTEVQPC